jgi:TrbB protein
MKSTDTVRLFEHSLYIQYGMTGEFQNVSSLRLDQGVTFTREANTISARYHNATAPFLIERFASDTLAGSAYQHLQSMVQRHARQRRLALACKGMLLWGALPAIGIMFMLVLNLALTRVAGNGSQAQLPMVVSNAVAAPPAATNMARPLPAMPEAPELAQAMADGVKAGKFSIAYSHGTKGTLYVFSDPSCPSCRNLERELVKLSKDYTIHIFPVSVIGGSLSARRLEKLMCALTDARMPMWKKVIAGVEPGGEECGDGATAVAANDQIFRAMRFEGTPTIVSAGGDKFPDTSPNTTAAIQSWMREHDTRK